MNDAKAVAEKLLQVNAVKAEPVCTLYLGKWLEKPDLLW